MLHHCTSILIAVFLWGPHLYGKRVMSNCENLAVVSVLNSRHSRHKDLMQLLRCLFFLKHTSSVTYPLTISQAFSKIVQMTYHGTTYLPLKPKFPCTSLLIPYYLFSYAVAAPSQGRLDLSQLDPAVQYFFCQRTSNIEP